MRLLYIAFVALPAVVPAQIDRQALVTRHSPTIARWSEVSPVQVGNGEFAFGMDLTGLQTFVPFNTLSQLGWSSSSPPADIDRYRGQTYTVEGRQITYPLPDPNAPNASLWLASNPHKINLGRLAIVLKHRDGRPVVISDLKSARQSLDLWSGIVTSTFIFDGQRVMVKTAAHPKQEAIGVQVFSPLVRQGRLAVALSAPGDDPRYLANYVGDRQRPSPLTVESSAANRMVLKRQIGDLTHSIELGWEGEARFAPLEGGPSGNIEIVRAEYGAADRWVDVTAAVRAQVAGPRLTMRVGNTLAPDPYIGRARFLRIGYIVDGHEQWLRFAEGDFVDLQAAATPHRWMLEGKNADRLSFTCRFRSAAKASPPTVSDLFAASRTHWPKFWKSGAAIDFTGTPDKRAKELERRVVLSQYQMAVNTAGAFPPQESGLVNNSWYGRFHMEMVWWHGAHWALWNRWDQLRRYLSIYDQILEVSKKTAASQGYLGARWPKAIGPGGREWPHEIHAFLAWQQPHPIFFAELDYRAHPTPETLKPMAACGRGDRRLHGQLCGSRLLDRAL